MLSVLGRGSFSVVYKVKHWETNELYAMKAMEKDKIVNSDIYECIATEYAAMSTIKHPFVMRLEWAFQDEDHVYFVIELIEGGDLFYHLYEAHR